MTTFNLRNVKFGLKNPNVILGWDYYHGFKKKLKQISVFTMVLM
jgi:hypothetical protein